MGLRLDVWLWRARFFKTRTIAARKIKQGRIRLQRHGQILRIRKPHTCVHPKDTLVFMNGDHLLHIEICALGTRRGSASEAQTLYLTTKD
ncbi:MAG: RNA-binding S4 domain-containing protein [Robiginitomaculum sp.]|nr:RNA-binding S4 domain-containing protein [Robiginitomaculum sp.]